MPLIDKDIIITPNKGASGDPNIVFSAASSSLGSQSITAQMYPINGGTLSFEGSAGQLFSISNNSSGTIYSVNDISGIPSIEVLDTGTIKLAETYGLVTIGSPTATANKLHANTLLNQATGNEVAYQLDYSVNKLTSGNDTGLIINQVLDTASPGTSLLLDCQVSGSSKASINNAGALTTSSATIGGVIIQSSGLPFVGAASSIYLGASNLSQWRIDNNAILTAMRSNPQINGQDYSATNQYGLSLNSISITGTYGTVGPNAAVRIAPTYNQPATAAIANTDLLINRTETTVGSGSQLFLDCQLAGSSKISLFRSGVISAISYLGADLTTIANNNQLTLQSSRSNGNTFASIAMLPGSSLIGNAAQVGVSITPTYNQSGSAGGTDLLINRTQTAIGSGSHYLIDAQVASGSKFSIDNNGKIITNITAGATGDIFTLKYNNAIVARFTDTGRLHLSDYMTLPSIYSDSIYSNGGVQPTSIYGRYTNSTAGTLVNIGYNNAGMAFTNSTGQSYGVVIRPQYSQPTTGSASNTDLLINRTETTIASAGSTQLLFDAQVGGVSKFKVYNTGTVAFGGSIGTMGQEMTLWSGSATSTNHYNFRLNTSVTADTGSVNVFKIFPVYNQATTASTSNTDFLISRTETSVASGTQLLIDARVGGTTKFNVSNSGDVYVAGTLSATNVSIGSIAINSYDVGTTSSLTGGELTTSSTASQVLVNIPVATYRSVKAFIQASSGSNIHVTELNAFNDGSNAFATEYGTVFNTSELGTFDVDVNAGNMRLLIAPISSGSINFKYYLTVMKV